MIYKTVQNISTHDLVLFHLPDSSLTSQNLESLFMHIFVYRLYSKGANTFALA